MVALVAALVFCIFYYSVSLHFLSTLPQSESTDSFLPHHQQNDANTLSSSEFYSRTVAAMEREAQRSSYLQKQESLTHEARQASADGKIKGEPPPVPPAKGQEHEAVLVAPDDRSVKPDKDGKGFAGRKKFKGGENWDVASGKQAPIKGKKKDGEDDEDEGKEKKEEKAETTEEHEVEVELNSILKKGPSMSRFRSSN